MTRKDRKHKTQKSKTRAREYWAKREQSIRDQHANRVTEALKEYNATTVHDIPSSVMMDLAERLRQEWTAYAKARDKAFGRADVPTIITPTTALTSTNSSSACGGGGEIIPISSYRKDEKKILPAYPAQERVPLRKK